MRIGVDLVSLERFAGIADTRPGFLEKCFTPAEQAEASCLSGHRRNQFLAGRFAVKEAVAKALGTGFSRGLAPIDIEALNADNGAPLLTLTGAALELAESMGLRDWQVSVAYETDHIVAFVVLTK